MSGPPLRPDTGPRVPSEDRPPVAPTVGVPLQDEVARCHVHPCTSGSPLFCRTRGVKGPRTETGRRRRCVDDVYGHDTRHRNKDLGGYRDRVHRLPDWRIRSSVLSTGRHVVRKSSDHDGRGCESCADRVGPRSLSSRPSTGFRRHWCAGHSPTRTNLRWPTVFLLTAQTVPARESATTL